MMEKTQKNIEIHGNMTKSIRVKEGGKTKVLNCQMLGLFPNTPEASPIQV